MTFNFQFTQAGAATWSDAAASGSDVLHLNLPTAFTGGLTVDNTINLYFAETGVTYEGGFFINGTADLHTANIADATLNYYLLDNANTDGTFYDGNYYDLYTGPVTAGTVQISNANFADGTVSGYTEQFNFQAAPEPSTFALSGIALLMLLILSRRGLTMKRPL